MANEIITEIILELDRFKKSLEDVEKQSKTSGKKSGSALADGIEKGFDSASSKLIKTAAAVGSALVAAFGLHKIVEAASEQEDAINSLNSALAMSGHFTEEASKRFQDYASHLQDVTTVDDTLIIKNAALLASLGQLSGDGLERASKAAIDLAAGLNMDVGTAFTLMSKAAAGNVEMLGRYGIHVARSGVASRDFAAALEQINRQFGGMAESKVNTFSGAMEQLKNRFGDLLEQFGNFVIKSPFVISAMKMLSKALFTFTENLKANGTTDVIHGAAKAFTVFGQSIVSWVLPPLELLSNMLMRPIKLMIGLAAAADAIANGNWGGAFEAFKAGLADSAKIMDFETTMKGQKFLDDFSAFLAKFDGKLKEMQTSVKNNTNVISNDAQKLGQNLSQIITGTMVKTVSTGMQYIGGSLIEGSKGFVKFRKAVYGILGDMCIRMGEAMIVQSGLFAAFAALVSNPFTAPAALVGFGLALMALGGVLKAAAGQGFGGGADSGGGGVAASAGGAQTEASTSTAQLAEPTRQEPQTNVTVQVQGNILDRRETGLAIADIINETFGSNGITYATSR